MKYTIENIELPKDLGSRPWTSSIIYLCKHCGTQLEAFYVIPPLVAFDSNARRIAFIKSSREARERTRNLQNCPICGNTIERSAGYFYEFEFSDSAQKESAEKKMLEQREQNERDTAQRESLDFIDCHTPATATPSIPASIKDIPEQLKSYVYTLLCLENNIYSLQQHLASLYYQRILNNRNINSEIYSSALKSREMFKNKEQEYQTALSQAEKAKAYKPRIKKILPEAPTPPIYAKPSLFNRKKVIAANEALSQKYQAEVMAYQRKCAECEAEHKHQEEEARVSYINKANERLAEAKEALDKAKAKMDAETSTMTTKLVPSQASKILLDREIAETEELLTKSLSTRNDLYAYEIIFNKYRNAVALSSLYEYLMSGRCSSLEGANGAYNIYENEIRMNRVITQIDIVVSSLEEIKQNQYMIYQELRSISASLEILNTTMGKALTSIQGIEVNTTSMNGYLEHISKNSDVIAHNTAVTAYYAKVNADLTNALGFMVALK